MYFEVDGRRPTDRPTKTWRQVLKEDMRVLNIDEEMAGTKTSGGDS